jgi:hypothetical protein
MTDFNGLVYKEEFREPLVIQKYEFKMQVETNSKISEETPLGDKNGEEIYIRSNE